MLFLFDDRQLYVVEMPSGIFLEEVVDIGFGGVNAATTVPSRS